MDRTGRKKVMLSECAYVLGLAALALGTALMEKADFGMSMVVAPAYLIYRKLSQTIGWFTFGMAEYCLQAFLLLVTSVILRRFKLAYLFSFGTALLYGAALDVFVRLVGLLPYNAIGWRFGFYGVGLLLCATGVALLFHTYLSPEAYELLVKEISTKFQKKLSVVKTVYDCCSCAVSIALSFLFFGFGRLEGVKLGTVICALVNGWLIGRIGGALEKRFVFRDGLKLRGLFL
ncbi:MAG: DUF6198 family protein [Roseburia sp.]|nr:DUF6198 family protein [Roseburia sp.]MCM1099293.1 DUF6198 family protein [Ruminococcus flavefaciens]